jgi:hypothetical protein
VTATVTNIAEKRGPALTPHDQLQCLVLAQMNIERAECCTPEQAALQAFFLMNSNLLLELAKR